MTLEEALKHTFLRIMQEDDQFFLLTTLQRSKIASDATWATQGFMMKYIEQFKPQMTKGDN